MIDRFKIFVAKNGFSALTANQSKERHQDSQTIVFPLLCFG